MSIDDDWVTVDGVRYVPEAPLKADIERLQELLRGTGANRYWEGRWRDADAENQKLRAALEEIAKEKRYPSHCAGIDCKRIARKALEDGK